MKRKKNKESEMNIATKEEEIIESYEEAEDDLTGEMIEESEEEVYEEIDDTKSISGNKARSLKRVSNWIFTIVIIILIMVAADVICVARYDMGPFFAIPLKTYEDGGSKAYYGIGYKVIKYHQTQGRRDKEIGFWSLKYNVEPITLTDIDLTIELTGNENKTYQKYYKKFVRVISTLKSIDVEKNQMIIGYTDEDGKYSLDIICEIVEDQNNLSSLEEGKEITIIGTVTDFKGKTEKENNRLYITNCFAEQ